MYNRLSSWWIRLYPASFRERYEDEMLLFFQDRMRDETGILARLRLQLDLLYDLTVTLPHVYLHPCAENANAGVAEGDLLTFRVLDEKRPSYVVYAASTIASLVVLHSIQSLHPCPTTASSASPFAFARLHGMFDDLFGFLIK